MACGSCATAVACRSCAIPDCRSCASASAAPTDATLIVSLDRPLARFAPLQAIGGALDGHGKGETLPAYAPESLRAMASAGLGSVSYRLRTELGVQAWHFDPAGQWSEPSRRQGYWTGTSRPPRVPPAVSWGYELPRRGDSTDQAEDSGYSRLDDGSAQTFWKSNPYLDSHYTREPEERHPQWVTIDLGRPRAVDALRIAWAAPYATRFQIQHYVGGRDAIALDPGRWVDFPSGAFHGKPGTQTVRIARAPLEVRFVRILMSASSHTAPATDRRSTGSPIGHHDVRDRLGYAIRELYLGTLEPLAARSTARRRTDVPQPGATAPRGLSEGERFHDVLVHAASKSQTTIYTSSTDPWHKAVDLNRNYEQPSFQTVMRSGLTRGQPLLVPVPLLYGTPENAVSELRYLRALHVPLRGVELGEEPDGQLVSPEDYGALYVRFARAIRRAFPHLPLGGPGFASSIPDWAYWPDAHGDRSWTRRFVGYLRTHRALRLLGFFSFEWYPFDDVCAPTAPQLARASHMLQGVLAQQHREGIPRSLPIYVTEYGYSAYAGIAEVGMAGALFDADAVGTLLSYGVKAAYFYGYEPNVPIRESSRCDTWGNLMLLREGEHGNAPTPVAAFWETSMLTHDWAQPGDRPHVLYATHWAGSGPMPPLHAYALRRPDGRLAVLLLNLDPTHAYRVRVRVTGGQVHARAKHDGAGKQSGVATRARLEGPLAQWTLSAATYAWHADGAAGAPALDRPPAHRTYRSSAEGVLLAPYSITVLRSVRS